jgi:hypothetical protein
MDGEMQRCSGWKGGEMEVKVERDSRGNYMVIKDR